MIKYLVNCRGGHEFEGWFRSSEDFDAQSSKQALSCPICGNADIRKSIMAPSIARGGRGDGAAPASGGDDRLRKMRSEIAEAARRAREYVEKNFDYVGDRFPEEARRIHFNEVEQRPIFGEATVAEARDLIEDGVSISPLPSPGGAPAKKLN